MASSSIPVDLFNPGQVFACLGFLETVEVLLGDAEGGFDWRDETDIRFHLRAAGKHNPFEEALGFLSNSMVISLIPPDSNNNTEKWGVHSRIVEKDASFPFSDPPTPAILPAALVEGEHQQSDHKKLILVAYWGDDERTGRDRAKFWAGSGGYPGAALLRDAIDLVRDKCLDAVGDPFSLSAEQSSSFRFDWRRDYVPIDIGFSLNAHSGGIAAVGFPLVEIFAAIGLSDARPAKLSILEYRYQVIGFSPSQHTTIKEGPFFPPMLLRAALGGPRLPFSRRSFLMRLGWPGKEGQARAITTVTEEAIS